MFIAALFIIAKTWKQRECPLTYEWIKIVCVYVCMYVCIRVCIYIMEYYSAIKKKIMSFAATWTKLELSH